MRHHGSTFLIKKRIPTKPKTKQLFSSQIVLDRFPSMSCCFQKRLFPVSLLQTKQSCFRRKWPSGATKHRLSLGGQRVVMPLRWCPGFSFRPAGADVPECESDWSCLLCEICAFIPDNRFPGEKWIRHFNWPLFGESRDYLVKSVYPSIKSQLFRSNHILLNN